jgi:hypothetical protein
MLMWSGFVGEVDRVNSKGVPVDVCVRSIISKFERLEGGLVFARDGGPEILEGIDAGPFI